MTKLEPWARWQVRVHFASQERDATVGLYATERAAKRQATIHNRSNERYGLLGRYSVRQNPEWEEE
jgi:hypothetical protein